MKEINTLERLYFALDSEYVQDNPFETRKNQEMANAFSEKYIKSARGADADEADMALYEILGNERQTAFKVGFQTAVSLLSGGGMFAV